MCRALQKSMEYTVGQRGVCTRRGGCAAALELLKKVAEKGPWAGVLQDALDWVRPLWLTLAPPHRPSLCYRLCWLWC